jgi:hypothetical protein
MAMTASHSGPQELSETSVYVYGVTWADGAAVPKSAGGDVAVVEQGELAAIVSPAPNGPVRTRRRELMRHLDVLRAVFASKTVLPVQFGSVFPGRAVVADELLSERYEELVELLHRFDGLAELRIRAVYREEAILAEIVEGDRNVTRLRELTRAAGRGADPLRVQLGEAVARGLTARRARDAKAISATLLGCARDAVVEEPRTEYELMRASYLVQRPKIAAFDARMDELAGNERDRIDFTYTGPLPPHSFVSLTPRRR